MSRKMDSERNKRKTSFSVSDIYSPEKKRFKERKEFRKQLNSTKTFVQILNSFKGRSRFVGGIFNDFALVIFSTLSIEFLDALSTKLPNPALITIFILNMISLALLIVTVIRVLKRDNKPMDLVFHVVTKAPAVIILLLLVNKIFLSGTGKAYLALVTMVYIIIGIIYYTNRYDIIYKKRGTNK